MLNTKAASDYLLPLMPRVESLHAVEIPGEAASFKVYEMAGIASEQGIRAIESKSVEAALQDIIRADRSPKRIVICGSLYLAGKVLAANH